MLPFIILLLCFSGAVSADQKFIGAGKVNHSEIQMILTISDEGIVEGEYFYINTQIPIPLKGTINRNRINLDTVGNIVEAEQFKGLVVRDGTRIVYVSGDWFVNSQRQERKHNFHVTSHDPFEDNHVTCKEMSLYPELVFNNFVDLGSGSGSKNSFERDCSNSLNNIVSLDDFLELADYIRLPSGNSSLKCRGSISRANRRYYEFDLAKLGYFPQSGNFLEIDNHQLFFESWSYLSLFNRDLYLNYQALRAHAKKQLAAWYASKYHIDIVQSNEYSEIAINYIDRWAYGWGSGSYGGVLKGTEEAISGEDRVLLKSLPKPNMMYSESAGIYRSLNTLNRLIVHNSSEDILKPLIQVIQPKMGIPSGVESPLSLASRNPDLLDLLIKSGFDVNHPNNFGKSPLFYAVQFGSYESVALLLNAGAEVNHTYDVDDHTYCKTHKSGGKSPLMHAAHHADVEIIELLLKYGADMSLKDEGGLSALEYARKSKNEDNIAFLSSYLPTIQ